MDSDGKLSAEDLVRAFINLAFADQVIRDFPGAWEHAGEHTGPGC